MDKEPEMSQQFIIHLGREVFMTAVMVASPMLLLVSGS